MKRYSPSQIGTWLQSHLTALRHQRFFRDRLSIGMLLVSLILCGGNLLLLMARLHPVDYPVPVHFNSLIGFDDLGPWYQHYALVGFSFATTVVNGVLAYKSFARSRITSFFLLISAFVVALFCLIISLAFTSLV